MISSNLGAGYALVPYPPDWNPNEGGGPVRKAPGSNVEVAHAGNTVYRTPNTNVREAEPGARWPGDLTKMMFLPDGRLVPATPAAYDMFRGAPEVTGKLSVKVKRSIGASVVAIVGAGFGAALAPSDRRVAGTVVGAVAGGILGLIFG